MTALLVWETPKWSGEVEKEIKLKKGGTSTRRRKISVPPAQFDNRREAVEWCRRHGIPTRLIELVTVQR